MAQNNQVKTHFLNALTKTSIALISEYVEVFVSTVKKCAYDMINRVTSNYAMHAIISTVVDYLRY